MSASGTLRIHNQKGASQLSAIGGNRDRNSATKGFSLGLLPSAYNADGHGPPHPTQPRQPGLFRKTQLTRLTRVSAPPHWHSDGNATSPMPGQQRIPPPHTNGRGPHTVANHHNLYFIYKKCLRTGLYLSHAAIWERLNDSTTTPTDEIVADDDITTNWFESFQ